VRKDEQKEINAEEAHPSFPFSLPDLTFIFVSSFLLSSHTSHQNLTIFSACLISLFNDDGHI
jgi:hypothetical protein